jgi:L-2-hydroxyglutarate oxidase
MVEHTPVAITSTRTPSQGFLLPQDVAGDRSYHDMMNSSAPQAEAEQNHPAGGDAPSATADYVVVGGGIIGLAVARQLLLERPRSDVVVLEMERAIAMHQTGRNSGVVHAGIYYPPGSQKATLTKRAIPLLRDFAREKRVPYEECGKLVIATSPHESDRLGSLLDNATANGVPGLEVLDGAGIREREPAAAGHAAIWSPTTAITDFAALAGAMGDDVTSMGGSVHTGVEVSGMTSTSSRVEISTRGGITVTAGSAIICAGLQSDRLARTAGDALEPTIVPFRGEYMHLVGTSKELVNGLIYPLPDPRYPFLGVHFTPTVHREVLVGPNALLALSRDGYRWGDIDPRYVGELLRLPGMWRLAARHWRRGTIEAWRSLNRGAYVRELQRYVPSIESDDLVPARAGVRAQAVSRNGDLLSDFVVTRTDRVVAVRNAPSPGATAALALAEEIVAQVPE